jgi:anaerobic selenocysteine-containing dehydrogenase/Fe-S-cluster-containing dehydrogenase component
MTESLIQHVGRRTFIKLLGAAAPAVAASACSPGTPERIIPYVIPPEDEVPGVATWYATTCQECPAGCGLRVRTREGRAVKVEGNPDHPVNRGRLCVRGQAALQGLYNPDRIRGAHRREVMASQAGQSRLAPVDWDEALGVLADRVRTLREAGRAGRIAIVTPLLTGALDGLFDNWAKAVGGARRLRYEPFGYEAIRTAGRVCFGRDAVPHYDLARANVLVSFGADFLETWLSTVEYTSGLADAHRLSDGQRSRFIHIEPRLSLTASSADEWLACVPGTEILIALAMVQVILAERRSQAITDADARTIANLVAPFSPDRVAERVGLPARKLSELARFFSDPQAGSGRSLAIAGGVAVSGSNATTLQAAVHLLNYVSGNVGTTVQFGPDASYGRVSRYRDLVDLVDSMRAGEVELLITYDVNPVFASPGALGFEAALERVPFVASFSNTLDETTARAHLILPTHTSLESWGDSEPRAGIRGLMQPVMQPLFDSRHAGDLLLDVARRVGEEVSTTFSVEDFYEYLRGEWQTLQKTGRSEAGASGSFDAFWADALQRGGTWREMPSQKVVLGPEVAALSFDVAEMSGDADALVLMPYASLHFYDGRGANRPWLQEIPDPVTKAVWLNWAEVHPETARALGAEEHQLLTVESRHGKLEVPLLLNPHLRQGVVAIPIGQGHTEYGRYASGRGVNPLALIDPAPEALSGGLRWLSAKVRVTPRDLRRPIPRLQASDQQFGRDVAQAVSLDELARGTGRAGGAGGAGGAGRAGRAAGAVEHLSLSPEHSHPVHHWGMAIDVDSCTGCNACVAACYAENNVPVAGAEAMRRGRTLSWLRIERFVSDTELRGTNGRGRSSDRPGPVVAGGDVRFVPMLCQHCDHAPCETVCPVYATYHTEEGLNAQVYNRCVGTRYCSNNCPYKVRRFNWFEPEFPDPLHLQLNPDVTVRGVGVMEKCTFCVQRIQEGKDRAKDENRPIRDGEIVPACAQTCPAQAIVFGDLNDASSRVSQLERTTRAYRIFDGLNTRPAVTYLKKVLV